MNIIQVAIFLSYFYISVVLCVEQDDSKKNITAPKDLYVVRATVYQVGILTNQTNETSGSDKGHQEAITLYRGNGSGIDLSSIPHPFLTNVTAEKLVGVAPVAGGAAPWDALKQFVSNPTDHGKFNPATTMESTRNISKREVVPSVQVEKGAAVIPSEAGVQSIALPPLLTLNKNLSRIPVPIPNVSVVSYSKVNTLVHLPKIKT